MKKLLSSLAVLTAFMLGVTSVAAQNLTIRVEEDGVWCNNKTMTPDEIGAEVEKNAPEYVFVYVKYNTPMCLLQDIQNAVAMNSTADVLFMNPDSYDDKGREYGPMMAMHVNFLEWGLLEDAKKMDRYVEYTAHPDFPDNFLPSRLDTLLRTRDKDGDLVNKYEAVCFNLAPTTTVGAVYNSLYAVNEKSYGPKGEMIPPINVLFKVPESDYSREAYIRIIETESTRYPFETVTASRRGKWAIYRKTEPMGPSDFAESLVAFKSISDMDVPGARPGKGRAIVEMTVTAMGTLRDVKIVRSSGLPGLDDVILKAISEAPSYWVPQFNKDENPINVKVTIAVTGEIGAY